MLAVSSCLPNIWNTFWGFCPYQWPLAMPYHFQDKDGHKTSKGRGMRNCLLHEIQVTHLLPGSRLPYVQVTTWRSNKLLSSNSATANLSLSVLFNNHHEWHVKHSYLCWSFGPSMESWTRLCTTSRPLWISAKDLYVSSEVAWPIKWEPR